MKQRENLAVTIGLLALPVTFLVLSARLSSVAALVPVMIAVPAAVLIAAQLRVDWRNPATPATGAVQARERSFEISMLILLLALYLFGFAVTLPIYAGLQWRTRAEGTWKASLAITIGLFAFLYGGLVRLLHVDLFEGILWTWFSS